MFFGHNGSTFGYFGYVGNIKYIGLFESAFIYILFESILVYISHTLGYIENTCGYIENTFG